MQEQKSQSFYISHLLSGITQQIPTSIKSGLLMGVTSRLLTLCLSFLLTVTLARWLGVGDYGTYASALSVLAVLTRCTTIGTPELIVRTLAASSPETRIHLAISLLIFGVLVSLVASAIFFTIYIVCSNFSIQSLFIYSSSMMTMLFIILIFASLSSNLNAILNGLGRIAETIWFGDVLRLFLYVTMILLASTWLLIPGSVILVLKFYAASSIMLVVILSMRIAYILSRACRSNCSWHGRKWIRQSVSLGGIGILATLHQQADILMLQWLSQPEEIGLFHAAHRSANLLSVFLAASSIPISPIIARAYNTGRIGEIESVSLNSLALVFFLSLIPAAFFLIFSEWYLVTIFGEQYRYAAITLVILVIVQVVKTTQGLSGIILKMTNNQGSMYRILVVSLFINVSTNALLIPFMGSIGAALATGLSATFIAFAQNFKVKEKLKINVNLFALSKHLRRSFFKT